ncbi:hypothetical protein QYF36_007295 [Acer negundo]|nr:hypothetical protein QYF36_007295 [Acer negundo]
MWTGSIEKKFSTPPPTWRKQRPPPSPMSERKTTMPLSANNRGDLFHVVHKVPAGDSPYVRAKHIQLIDKDPSKAISLFWAAINAGDRVDSALKDMAVVMKQLDRSDEAIEAIKSFRHLCPHESQESLDNVLIELYKRSGRIEEEIEMLKHKLQNIEGGIAFGGARTKMARSQGKKIQITIEQERSRILGNLAWAYMQQNDYETAEPYYRQALSLETDKNKQCNLAICLMYMNKMTEAKFLLQAVRSSAGNRPMDISYAKSYERAFQMLTELEASNSKENRASLPGIGVSCAHQKAYASPVLLTQPRRPSSGPDNMEQRRDRWRNDATGNSSDRKLHSKAVPFTQPRRPFTHGFNFGDQTRGKWGEEKVVGRLVRKLSFDQPVTIENMQGRALQKQKPKASLPSLTSEDWKRQSWRDVIELKDEAVVVQSAASQPLVNRDRKSTCWGNDDGFVQMETGALVEQIVDGNGLRNPWKYGNDQKKSALKESNSSAMLPTGQTMVIDNIAVVLKTSVGEQTPGKLDTLHQTVAETLKSGYDCSTAAKDKKSWADIVEEEEEEEEEQEPLSSKRNFREGLGEFIDENLNSNIIYPSPCLQNQDLNDGYGSKNTGVLSRNPTVRRSLCYNQEQTPESTDSMSPMKDNNKSGKNINAKRRNRLQSILTVGFDHPHQPQRSVTLRTTPENDLRIRPGCGIFKIALFADLHFGENAWTDWGPRQDVNSVNVMSTVLDHETPDFVVYLGDVITANNIAIANASLYWDQAISPTRARGIPWASVFGNHDDAPFQWPLEWFSAPGIPQLHCPSSNVSYAGEEECEFRGTRRVELMKKEIDFNMLSHSKNGPKHLWPSISNYVLQVSSSKDPQMAVLYMYFLDSGGGSYPEVISSAQAEWFQRRSQEINPDSRVPEIVFWHIPSKAYKKVAPKFGVHRPCVGSINKESVAAQEAETGIMKTLVKRSSVKAVFVGHNHGLDWCCPYRKLWLCFARHTGYGGYGNWPRGARILEIIEQPFSIKSWIRMEDGSVHSGVILTS